MPLSFGFSKASSAPKISNRTKALNNVVLMDALNYSGSGTSIRDASNRVNTMTLVNGPTLSDDGGKSFVFDGTDDYIEIAHAASLNVGQTFSISCWVKAAVMGQRFGLYSTRTVNVGGTWQLEIGQGNGIHVTGFQTYVISTGSVLTANVWYHIAYVRNGSGAGTVYLNGVAQTPTATAPGYVFSDNTNAKRIGSGTGDTQRLNGKIAFMRVDSIARTEDDIRAEYNATRQRYSSLVSTNLAMHLDAGNTSSYPGSGTTWTDLSGANRNATLRPGMTYSSSEGQGSIVFTPTTYATISGTSSFIHNTAYTKSVWVKFTSTGNFKNLISSANNNAHAFWVPEGFNGVFQKLCTGHNGQWTATAGATTIQANVWYNFSMTFSPTNGMRVYINGVLDGSNATLTTTFSPTDSLLYIGSYGLLDNGFNGFMTTALIYTRELSAQELLQNFNATKSRHGL